MIQISITNSQQYLILCALRVFATEENITTYYRDFPNYDFESIIKDAQDLVVKVTDKTPVNIAVDRPFVIDYLKKMQSKHAIADAYIEADNMDALRIYWAHEVGRYELQIASLIKLLETRDDDRRKSP